MAFQAMACYCIARSGKMPNEIQNWCQPGHEIGDFGYFGHEHKMHSIA